MKIKRVFATNARQAMRTVREQLGPDAVILSNRRVADGIEVVAAVDYDASLFKSAVNPTAARPAAPSLAIAPRTEPNKDPTSTSAEPASPPAEKPESLFRLLSALQTPQRKANPATATPPTGRKSDVVWAQDPMLADMYNEIKVLRGMVEEQLCGLAWGDQLRRQPQRAGLLRRLVEYGLSPRLCQDLADEIGGVLDLDRAWFEALGRLCQRLPVIDDDIVTNGGVVALVGPTGVGKTTTVAKLAARFTLRHGPGRVALVTTDGYRIGAHEQLRTFGRILDLPVRVAADEKELRSALQGLEDKDLILVDTAGMGQRDLRLSEQLAMLNNGVPQVKVYLVLAATTQIAGLEEIVSAFQDVKLNGCIATKVDEAGRLGALVSVIIDKQLPLAYLSDGQRVPEDLQPARAQTVISTGARLMRKAAPEIDNDVLALAFGGMLANAGI